MGLGLLWYTTFILNTVISSKCGKKYIFYSFFEQARERKREKESVLEGRGREREGENPKQALYRAQCGAQTQKS